MKIGHVHIKVRDLSRSQEFYQKLLGARQTERLGNRYAFLSMGRAHHEIALQALGDLGRGPAPDMVGLYHTAFEVQDAGEMLSVIERLKQLGVEYTLVDHGISWAVYTSDPDGNGVEVYLDRRSSRGGAALWNGNSRALSPAEIEQHISSC